MTSTPQIHEVTMYQVADGSTYATPEAAAAYLLQKSIDRVAASSAAELRGAVADPTTADTGLKEALNALSDFFTTHELLAAQAPAAAAPAAAQAANPAAAQA